MKKIAVGIAIVFGFTLLQPVNAQASNQSIAIIDMGFDTSIPVLKSKVVQEVCIATKSIKCSNGQSVQEGAGAATLPSKTALSANFVHGTQMSLIANQVNPNTNLILIRILDDKVEGALTEALKWVIDNKTKYNIVSVSASLTTTLASLRPGLNYCPSDDKKYENTIKNINTLISLGIPTVFPSGNGNNSKYTNRILFPACISQAVAIGATTESDDVSPKHYAGDLVDFYALAWYDINALAYDRKLGRVVGTSASAVAFSAFWAKNYKGDYQSTYNYIKSISKSANGFDTLVKVNSFVNVLG